MKKVLCALLTLAILLAFAACNKNKGEIYVEPPTEVITFADGETAVYEVVTDAAGEAVTDENGENEVVLYDPPVTEKGGYLVTDPEGSTIKQSATTVANTAVVENEELEFDTPANGTTAQSAGTSTTAKNESTTNKSGQTQAATTGSNGLEAVTGENKTQAAETTTAKTNSAEKTTAADLPEGETGEFGTEISKADAQKLYDILDFDNTFDEALCKPDYFAAETELNNYIASIENAIAQIKADKDLYQYVGNENLNLWLGYMNEAKEKYAIFMGIYRGCEGSAEYPNAFYTTYEDFQDSYRDSLKIYYAMRTGAEAIMYSY